MIQVTMINFGFFTVASVVFLLLNVGLIFFIWRKRQAYYLKATHETLVQSMACGIIVLNDQDRILEINTPALSFLGIGNKEIIGCSVRSSGATDESLLNAMLDQHSTDKLEIRTESGVKFFTIDVHEIEQHKGSRLVVIHDITNRSITSAAEEICQDRLNMFRLMADNMPDLMWAKDTDNKYIFTNKAICETLLHAQDTDEPIGKTDLFFAERERQKFPQRHDWHTFGKSNDEAGKVISLKPQHSNLYGNVNGKFLFLDVWETPVIDKNGTITGVVGSARDITAQKKSLSEIYRRDRLLDAISQATAMLVQNDNLDEAINGALQIIGSASEVNRVYIFRNGDYPGQDMRVMSLRYEWNDGTLEPMINDPRLQEIPYESACPGWFEKLSEGFIIAGNVREFPEPEKMMFSRQGIKSILITPVFIDKIFWGFIGFDDCRIERRWTSIEERLLAAAANTFGAAYLRKKNQNELIAAKEKAEESERLKSAFLANMSHEIRTPMNGILGFAGLLKEPKLTGEEQQEYIGIIEKSGARMLNIINDIISISKVESGQMKLTLSETNINSQIGYIYTFFRPQALQKGIQLSYKNSLPEKEAIILTDKEKIYAILTNLINNALKFTESGAIEFGYRLKNSGEKPEMEFFVKDTGLGIRQGQQAFIFERFRQGNEMLNRNYEGAGLGLSISKAYVEMLGGKIWVESGEGQGSVFYFTIPYHQQRVGKTFFRNRADVLPDKPVNNLKILIAEDDEISEKLMFKSLEGFSREILVVRTGKAAVEACRNHPDIDLVMMDIKMPEMDGYEATEQIRKFNTAVVIIAQTGFALSGDKEKALVAGCSDYVSKPINQALLQSLLQKHF